MGFARTKMSDDDFRKSAGEFLPKGQEEGADDAKKSEFLKNLNISAVNYDDAAAFQNLAKRLEELDQEGGLGGNRLFYLATPPEVYTHVIQQLKKANLTKYKGDKSWTRIIIEKPFGRDWKSAKALNPKFSKSSTNRRSTASITTSAKKPCRTCWYFASATAFSSRSGIAITSTACRSPPLNPSESNAALPSMKPPAPCAT